MTLTELVPKLTSQSYTDTERIHVVKRFRIEQHGVLGWGGVEVLCRRHFNCSGPVFIDSLRTPFRPAYLLPVKTTTTKNLFYFKF